MDVGINAYSLGNALAFVKAEELFGAADLNDSRVDGSIEVGAVGGRRAKARRRGRRRGKLLEESSAGKAGNGASKGATAGRRNGGAEPERGAAGVGGEVGTVACN